MSQKLLRILKMKKPLLDGKLNIFIVYLRFDQQGFYNAQAIVIQFT